MKKLLGAATAAILTATVLAGCGGDNNSSSGGGYCDDIKSTSTDLKDLGKTDAFTADKFTAITDAVHKIAGEAPSDIKPSWTLIDTQFSFLTKTLADAGVSMDDFSKLASGQTPSGLDPAKMAALGAKLQQFDTAGLDSATTKIQNQVKSDCDIDLDALNS
jgi:hypothetical protein